MTAKTTTLPPRLNRHRDPEHNRSIEWLAERSDERFLLTWACVVAVLVHGLAFLIDVPEAAQVQPPPPRFDGPVITPYHPPPPPLSAPTPPTVVDTTPKAPLPEVAPTDTGPVVEPSAPITDDVLSDIDDVDFGLDPTDLVTTAGPPEPDGPRIMTPEITSPVLLEDSKIAPQYPEIPRRAQISGSVILQAVILRDGSVGELLVLRATPPSLGFEQAAIEAVRQWRYEPARQGDTPVEVYFTVHVSFELR